MDKVGNFDCNVVVIDEEPVGTFEIEDNDKVDDEDDGDDGDVEINGDEVVEEGEIDGTELDDNGLIGEAMID